MMWNWLAFITLATFAPAAVAQTCPPGLDPPTGYTSAQLIFDDSFTGSTLDASHWNQWMGNDQYGRWGDSGRLPSPYSADSNQPGGYAREYNDPYPAGYSVNLSGNHLVTGSGLSIISGPNSRFAKLGYYWASSAISSYGKVYLPASGGYVQYRAKMPDSTHGAWAVLWMLPRGTGTGGAEIDIQESGYLPGNGAPNANYMLASNWHGQGGTQAVQNAGVDLSSTYHVYGIEYNPNGWIKVYLDGALKASWVSGVNGVGIGNDAYELIIGVEMMNSAGQTPDGSGWHTISNTVNFPGPFELDVSEVQVYNLH